MNLYPDFNWAAEFEQCENEHDLRNTGRIASARIKDLEARVKQLIWQRDTTQENVEMWASKANYYRDQLISIHELVRQQHSAVYPAHRPQPDLSADVTFVETSEY